MRNDYLNEEIFKAWKEFNRPANRKTMSKEDRKEYKRLLSWRNFLQKKRRKLEKYVDLYEKLGTVLEINLYNAISNIENKYK